MLISGVTQMASRQAVPFGYAPSCQSFDQALSSAANAKQQTPAAAPNARAVDQTVSCGTLTLHWFDTEEGDRAIACRGIVGDGSSMTVYRPADFDEAHPVYKVKVWDAEGNVTEQMIDVSEIDLSACNVVEMYAYAAHLSASGEYPDALMRFMTGSAVGGAADNSYADLFKDMNWLDVFKEAMLTQYNAGNLNGYMEYKHFLELLQNHQKQTA